MAQHKHKMHKMNPTLNALLEVNQKPKDGKAYSYGTAGFRMLADKMDPVALRVAIYAGSMNRTVGVMITASHNPVQDNGIKLVDSNGEMVGEEDEERIAWLANATDEEVLNWVGQQTREKSRVIFGRDTRPSGERLLSVMKEALEALGVDWLDFGLLTTPQLHHYVRSVAEGKASSLEEAETLYYEMLTGPIKSLFNQNPVHVIVDCANGIGGKAVKELNKRLQGSQVTLETINDGSNGGILNHECGADYVKTGQCPPAGLKGIPRMHYASLDGDADRIVFYYFDKDRFCLLDGDRIACLLAVSLKKMLGDTLLTMACIQTAYANGASTAFLASAGIETVCTCTGVKNLHHAAKSYDIGVYFEANGHGTVILSDRAKRALSPELTLLLGLVNECVGDAISDLLLVEAVLAISGLDIEAWAKQYQELPNVLKKVAVADRLKIVTGDADRVILKPEGLQAKIDELVRRVPGGRSFARPSGTEDVVRVYAEAATPEDAVSLAQQVCQLIQQSV